MARIITITSGKGGVGKTSISVNLALCLARLENRVCLFDADLGLANVDLLLGLYPQKTLKDVVFGRLGIDDVIITAAGGMDIIPGSSGIAALANLDSEASGRLIQALEGMREYDFLLIDTSAGVSQNVLAFGLAAPEVVLVMAPEITAVTDAYALLKLLLLNGFNGTLHVVVNRCRRVAQGRQVFTKFYHAVRHYLDAEVSLLGIVVDDPQVEAALKFQQPFADRYPACPAAGELTRIAGKLASTPPSRTPGGTQTSYWQRWINRLARPLKLPAPENDDLPRPRQDAPQPPAKDSPQIPQPPLHPSAGVRLALPHLQSDPPEELPAETLPDDAAGRLQLPDPVLPVLPQIALACMQACQSGAPLQEIARRAAWDAALCANLFSLDRMRTGTAGSTTAPLEAAVARLGRKTVETLALHSVHFAHLDRDTAPHPAKLKALWQHTLQCAHLARLLAQEIGFRDRQAAYLAGLLHDVGRLLPHAGRKALLEDTPLPAVCKHGTAVHARAGARLLASCGLSTLLTDAVCYHHAPPAAIRNAFGLVKIVHAANALCCRRLPPPAAGLETSARTLEIQPATARRLAIQAWKRVAESARSLDIRLDRFTDDPQAEQHADADHQGVVFRILRERALLGASLQPVLEAENPGAVRETISRTLQLLFKIPPALFFSYDPPSDTLFCQTLPTGVKADLRINVSRDRSLLAACCRQRRIVTTFEDAAEIMDEQLAHLLGVAGIVCIPLVFRHFSAGVMVLGADASQADRMRDEHDLLRQLARQGACAQLLTDSPAAASPKSQRS